MADVAAELVPELHSQELVDALVEASECDRKSRKFREG